MQRGNTQFLKMATGAYWVAIGIWATTVSTIFVEDNKPLFLVLFIVGAIMLVMHTIFSEISKNRQAKRITNKE